MDNYASYKPGTFTIDISNFEKAQTMFHEKDMPAFIHEYCHYIQDITTISSIFGFSLWFRDLVNLVNISSNGEGKTITIPFERDIHGERVNKFRSFYSLYCGDGSCVLNIDFSNHKLNRIHFEIKDIDLDGNIQKLGVNEIELSGRTGKLRFGLIVLQEIHAYYSQKLAETKPSQSPPQIFADDLPSFPYKFGDFLFDNFEIVTDLETKFIISGLCLDTVQAPTIFLKVLEELKGSAIAMVDIHYLETVVEKCRLDCSYSNQDAFDNIIPDLQMWAASHGRVELTASLDWYLEKVMVAQEFKRMHSPLIFMNAFCMDWKTLGTIFMAFPAPVYFDNGILAGNLAKDDNQKKFFLEEFERASTFWAHRIIFDLLCSKDLKEVEQRCECPLLERCEIRLENDEEYTYICKRSPWEIVKGKQEAPCIYGMAVHSMGLWQNDLEINTDAE